MDPIAIALELAPIVQGALTAIEKLIAAGQAKGDPVPQELVDQHAAILATNQRIHDLLNA